jgi:hypothetical protein
MNREALLRLSDKLCGTGPYEAVGPIPATKFDMEAWVRHDKEHCGTAACAAGHACLDPWFNDRGLSLEKITTWMDAESESTVPVYTPKKQPVYMRETGFQALAKFFDVTGNEAAWLFDPFQYHIHNKQITPEMVSNRIQNLLGANS